MLAGCSLAWDERFLHGKTDPAHERMFRSLEVACQACRVPAIGTQHPTIHDVGVGVALWVSALEVLCHPPTGDASREVTLAHLGTITWQDADLAARRYTMQNREGKDKKDSQGNVLKYNFIEHLCGELYRARNDFLHGNPVNQGSLHPAQNVNTPTLLYCAPLVYRAALVAAFDPLTGPPDLSKDMSRWFMWNRYERALKAIMNPSGFP